MSIDIDAPDKEEPDDSSETQENTGSENTDEPTEAEPTEEPTESISSELVDGLRPEFKEAMDAYEEFMNEYCEFMEKYAASDGTDLGLLADYATYMSKYAEAMEAFEASYQIFPTEETLYSWLKAARLYYPDNQYVEIIGDREDLYELSLSLEEQIKDIEANFVTNEEGRELEKLNEWMQYGGKEGYRVASTRVLRDLCETFRAYHNANE